MNTKPIDYRFAALWRFGIAITILNLLGHTVLGFEQSWAQPLVSLATAYSMEILLEVIEARLHQRPLRFRGSLYNLVNFLLPAHITGLAVAMLLYTNDRLMPMILAAAVAIGSKAIFRIPGPRGSQHFLNPSNFGITVTLLLFPWVGIAPPYHFTENLSGAGDWILPGLIVASGTFLNSRFTRKMPLILAWLGGFGAQAVLRSLFFGTPLTAALLPMSGLAFVLYTFYMVTDPGTTPFAPKDQVLFGLAVAAVYGLLLLLHVVFGLFFALTIVCVGRGLLTYARLWLASSTVLSSVAPTPAMARRSEL
jgi:Na+-translocating ferredoxin:NAD+ oxidoreductase RnfD subunit